MNTRTMPGEAAANDISQALGKATVALVMYIPESSQLLDDIVIVAVESDERCLECLRMYRTLFQNYTTVISSTKIHTNNCLVLIN